MKVDGTGTLIKHYWTKRTKCDIDASHVAHACIMSHITTAVDDTGLCGNNFWVCILRDEGVRFLTQVYVLTLRTCVYFITLHTPVTGVSSVAQFRCVGCVTSECDTGQACRVCIFSHSTHLCVYSHTLYLEARQMSSNIKQVALICVTFERASSFGPHYCIVRLRSALTCEKFHPSRTDLWVHRNDYKSARY